MSMSVDMTRIDFIFVMLMVATAARLDVSGETETNRRLIVTSIIEEPYLLLRQSNSTGGQDYQDNDRFTGYGADLIKKLAAMANFTYEIRLVKDSQYGMQDANGTWSGMIGELVRKEADLALAALTVTSKREQAVDFTYPFMHSGITIMMKKPSTYNSAMLLPIASIEELTKQTQIEYGMIRGGSVSAFFRDSQHATFKKIWENMNSRPSGFVNSVSEGVQRVRTAAGNYAFIGEANLIDYINHREPCDTIQVGGIIDSAAIAIAIQSGSVWRERLSSAILQLKEDGTLTALREMWWSHNGNCPK